jgi:hypothetical protein
MAKTTSKVSSGKPTRRGTRRPKRKSLAELTAWMTANHDALLKKARGNSIRLTGKPTFGGTRRKKSA